MKADSAHPVKVLFRTVAVLILSVCIVAPAPLLAASAPSAKSKPHGRLTAKRRKRVAHFTNHQCSAKWLKEKDCQLRDRLFEVQVWQDEIMANDERHRDSQTLPYSGDAIEWQSVGLTRIGPRRFVEIQLWNAPDKVTGISSRIWLVYEWRQGILKKQFEASMQKRKMLSSGQYRFDPICKFGLKLEKKHIIWHCDRTRGDLGPI